MDAPKITTYYEADHDRLDELFRQYQQTKRVDFPKAKDCFKQFRFGLQRHIVWEEEILFPLFEQKTGIQHGGPTDVMRSEHLIIKKYLEDIHDKVRVQNPETDIEEQAMLEVLSAHNQKEEMILYPAIDHSVTSEERGKVFTSMENTPEERYHECCPPADYKK